MGHSLQLLDNVYIQQLKGQQILGGKEHMAALGHLQSTLEPYFVLMALEGHRAPHHPRFNSVQIHDTSLK